MDALGIAQIPLWAAVALGGDVLRAARGGAVVGAVVAALVALLSLVPPLLRGYPLALLPLLAAGPGVASGGSRHPLALLARGFVAGLAAAGVAVAALVFAVETLGVSTWTLLGAASYPPMPPLPRPDLLPGVGWPHEDILLLLPPLSAVLALVWGLALDAPRGGLVDVLAGRLALVRASIQRKLVWVLLSLALLATAVGWVGFSALEDIHLRGHRFQLLADWLGHTNQLGADLERVGAAARLSDPGGRAVALATIERSLNETLDHLERAPAHPSIAVSGPALQQLAATYRDDTARVRAASERLLAAAGADVSTDPAEALRAAEEAQRALAMRLQRDLRQGLDQTDLQHHTSLMALMALVLAAAVASLLLGQAAAASITRPVGTLGAQLARLGRGDFTQRVAVANRDELGELAARLNTMAAELERLYAVEREGRRQAEADGARLAAQNAELERVRAALQAAKADLERRVDERTAELADVSMQLRQAQKMDAIGQLAGGVAHDFNNLLTIINGYGDLLLSQLAADDPRRAGVVEIVEAGEQAAALTNQLLTFSRWQIRHPEVLDLDVAVTDMARMLRRLLGEDVELVTRLAGEPLPVEVDRGQLQQVLLNLAVNARDAMPRGGQLSVETAAVQLDDTFVRAHPGAHTGAHVRLSVHDTGCGMDADTQARIFEPFFTTKEPGKGTGLGLSRCMGSCGRAAAASACAARRGAAPASRSTCPARPSPPRPPRWRRRASARAAARCCWWRTRRRCGR